jgi:hypothetical protein
MADDQPTQTTPGHTALTDTTGARSAYDPPTQSPQDVSAAALAGQLRDMLSGSGVGTDSGGGVQRTVTRTPGLPPVTWHTASISYEVPFGG